MSLYLVLQLWRKILCQQVRLGEIDFDEIKDDEFKLGK